MTLQTPADLAELFGEDEATILRWRLQYAWPSIKVGRKIRFTQEHVDQILAKHEAKHETTTAPEVAIAGQTERSRRRAS